MIDCMNARHHGSNLILYDLFIERFSDSKGSATQLDIKLIYTNTKTEKYITYKTGVRVSAFTDARSKSHPNFKRLLEVSQHFTNE